MTITIVNIPPLPFEEIVVGELSRPLATHGFHQTPTFHKFVGQQVEFRRKREPQEEVIRLQRGLYSREHLEANNSDDELEAVPIDFGSEVFGSDPCWVSRHSLSVQFIVDGATNWLQTDGRAGTGDNDVWHFTDEDDLRRLLRDTLLPLLLTAGLQTFNEAVEEKLEKAPTAA